MQALETLEYIRSHTGDKLTTGLSDQVITEYLARDKKLETAIQLGMDTFLGYEKEFPHLMSLDEQTLIDQVQEDYVNFYVEDAINPYVSLAAMGPWLITTHGAVLYDTGGYGMLGLGHSPADLLSCMNQPLVMANVMTANLSQKKLAEKLIRETSRNRQTPPYTKFISMNSGSEAVTVAARISDINAKKQTAADGRHAGKSIKLLSLKGSFHGRTDRPAQASDSTMKAYKAFTASFQHRDNLITVEANNCEALQTAFDQANRDNIYIEMMLMEPVMGEGSPGVGITSDFYQLARKLTKANGTLFLVDSIQAGLRAHGCLSVASYPGFENLDPPDMETFSKALNGGQYPISILAMTEETSNLYRRGVYGNTMTANPRGMEAACYVLDHMTEARRDNIVNKGKEMIQKFLQLGNEFPEAITNITGTGLLCAIHLNKDGYPVIGKAGIERYIRTKGIGVIHGGENALRFTPYFDVTSEDIDLIVDCVRNALLRGPVYQ